MKKSLLLFSIALIGAISVFAQAPLYFNTNANTAANTIPMSGGATQQKSQIIYGPGVFTGAFLGLIDTIWLRPSATGSLGPYVDFEVSLGQNVGTTTIHTVTTFNTGLTSAFYSPSYMTIPRGTAPGGWMPIPLTTPFLYNPALSLVVELKHNGVTGGSSCYRTSSAGLARYGAYAATTGTVGAPQLDLGISLASNLSCATPSNVTMGTITQNTASVGWTDNNTVAPAGGWDIEYGGVGFTPTGIPTINVSTNPFTLTSLVQNTAYDVYVRAHCGPNDSSYYASVQSFITLAQCPFPSNLTATNITSSSADLNWTENGVAMNWGIEIGLQGFTPTGNPTLTTTTKPYTLGSLPNLFTFDYYVRSICGPGDTSASVGPYTFTVCSPLSGNYTIDSTIAQGGTNFQSFAQANTILQTCGVGGPVTISVLNAVNNEQLELVPINGMSATNTVTFNGHGTATLTFTASASPYATLLLNDADYFRFDSIKFESLGTVGFAAQLYNGASNNHFTNCTFEVPLTNTGTTSVPFAMSGSLTSATTAGLAGTSQNNNKLENCTTSGGYYNLTMYGNTATGDSNNQVINCKLYDFYFYGAYSLYQDNLLFSGNELSRPTRTGLTTFYGIYNSGTMTNCVYDRNHIHNPFTANPTVTSICYPIYALGDANSVATSNIYRNNLIEDINSNGNIYGIFASAANYIQIYHNTISLDNTSAGGTGVIRGISNSATTNIGQDFRNNNISITQGGTGLKHGIYNFVTTASNITCRNNNVYGTSANFNYGYNGGVNCLDLAAWQASAPSVGIGSEDRNPFFVSPSINNYMPSNANLDNKGAPLGVLTDFLSAPRSATVPDMGAFEFSVSCPNPNTITASNLAATSLSLSWVQPGPATTWQIEQLPMGSPQTGVPTYTNVNTNTNYPITGLTQYQSYDFYVRGICGPGDSSVWTGPFSVLVCAPLAGTYTINTLLPPSATNFTSFGAAAAALNCGIGGPVIFNVNNATYTEQVIFTEVVGASPTNTITFNGNGATVSSVTTATDMHVIRLDGADYFRFNNLTVTSPSTATAIPMHLLNVSNPTNNNIFTKCTFSLPLTTTVTTTVAFAMTGSATSATTAMLVKADSNILDSCTILGGNYCIAMYGKTTAPYSANNEVKNCIIQDFYIGGMLASYQDNLLVSGNDISRPTRTSSSTTYAVHCPTGSASNQVLEKNYVHNMFNNVAAGTAYYFYMLQDAVDSASSNIVRNNVIEDINGTGTHYLMYLNSATNIKVHHNTLLMNVVGGASAQRGIMQAGAAIAGQDIRNNIIVNSSTGTGIKYGIYSATLTVPYIYDYNNIYISSTTGTNYYGYFAGNLVDLTAWKGYSPTMGQNDQDVDPTFLLTSPNFTPSNAAINSTGTGVGVTDDYYGNPRAVTAPDMGAFEWASAGIDMGITLLTSPDPATGCYSANETINVRVVNFGGNTINFSSNPMTVTANVTGVLTTTASAIVNTGTLAPLGVLIVPLTPAINMVSNGSYSIHTYIATVGDAIAINDTLAPIAYNVNLSAGTLSVSPDVHCVSGVSTVSLSGSMGGIIQFQSSNTTTGPWTNVGTGGTSYTTSPLTSTTYFRAYAVCNSNSDTTNVDTVVVINPVIVSTMNDTICGPNAATLSAVLGGGGGNSINWYDAPTGGTKLDTGMTFVTPIISVTDTFYAVGSAGSGANDSVQLNFGSNYTGMTRGYLFTAPVDFTITSLFVPTNASSAAPNIAVMTFPTLPTTATTTIYNVLYSTFANANTTGWIPVNIPILTGDIVGILGDRATNSANVYSEDPSITINGMTIPIFRLQYQGDLGTSTLPVPLSNAGTSSKGTTNFTYAIGCEGSPRTPVIAVVNPSSGDLALATSTNASSTPGLDSLNDMQPDGATVNYFNPNCNLIAKIVDAPGGNILGQVTSKVNVDATVNVWNGQPYARRWYDINVASNGPATVTLYYTQADFNDYNAHPSVVNNTYGTLPTGPSSPTTNIRITKISGGALGVGTVTGVITPTTVWNATAMRWEMTFPVTAFSQFFLHAANPSNAALSVNLGDFTVVKNGGVSDASWYTLMEENNSHFNVQRSTDGRTFNQIGKVYTQASGGNSNEKLSYSFTDEQPQIGHNYYRLEQVDRDGKQSYSGIVDLVWGADGSVVSIYPNPATDKLNIDVSIDKVTQMEVRLLDMSGRVVKSAMLRTVKGMNNVTLNLSDVASGVYGVQIFDNNNLIHTAKVNKQSKE